MGAGRFVETVERSGPALPRYERPHEEIGPDLAAMPAACVSYADSEAAIATSGLSEGGQGLLRGLLRLGTARVFPGGGVGIEYGSLLKTAARPEYLAAHAAEAAAHLRTLGADVLFVPGMSGYPVAAMYSVVSGIPAVFLKKAKLADGAGPVYPAGAFVIPSYTGEGDVVMHADQDAAQDIVDAIVAPQLDAQRGVERPVLTIRAAGADDIIDKATMSLAVGENAVVVGTTAIQDFARRHREATGDPRPIDPRVEVVGWVTPLIKGYNAPQERLERAFGVQPFAGINVTSVHLDTPAIGVEGVGVLAFAPSRRP